MEPQEPFSAQPVSGQELLRLAAQLQAMARRLPAQPGNPPLDKAIDSSTWEQQKDGSARCWEELYEELVELA